VQESLRIVFRSPFFEGLDRPVLSIGIGLFCPGNQRKTVEKTRPNSIGNLLTKAFEEAPDEKEQAE
jgi:hypothetical protein